MLMDCELKLVEYEPMLMGMLTDADAMLAVDNGMLADIVGM
jgi:hypothetical protein